MQTPTILILPFHGIGHFNGLFGIARALQKTHQVEFAGTGYFRNHVTSQGFTYRTLSSFPFGLGLEGWVHKIRRSPSPIFRNVMDRFHDTLYRERMAELTTVLNELKPLHVLVDAQQATDVIVLKAIDPNLRISIVNIPPPYLLMPGVPPANSLALPDDTKAIKEAYRQALMKIRDKQWRQRIKYFIGLDDRAIVQRRLRRNKMMHLKADYPSLITFAAKNIDQYVLTYREFDFTDERMKDLKYVGPHVDRQVTEQQPNEFKGVIESIRSAGRKIVYCSFGTVPSERNTREFITRLSKAAAAMNVCAIVSSKNAEPCDTDHLKVYDWVPQWLVLGASDIFITHGGINSVHDGIRFGTPMLVYPLDKTYDQNGNSSRVVYHGFGLRGDIDSDTVDDIQKKMTELFTDISFRKNLDEFKHKTSYYTTDYFVKMLLS